MNIFYKDGHKIELRETISKGAYGTVFNGLFKGTLPVAIKKQSRNTESSLIEWEMISMFNSEYIVKGIFSFYHGPNLYMVLEKADCNLYEYVSQFEGGIISDNKLFAAVTAQIIKGVSIVHKLGVIHRDIKSKNILIRGNTFKLCDFGFSVKLRDGLSLKIGTNTYMAPEVIVQHEYGTSCDIWSLGVLLYSIRTGEFPFRTIRKKAVATLRSIAETMPVDGPLKDTIRKFLGNVTLVEEPTIFDNKDVSNLHQDLILACLQTDPSRRPTADELLTHYTYMDLSEEDFDKIPPYVPRDQ